ncbi:MAG: pyrroloquinoline quinone biosynthesis peptide chaperone PqqD [Nitrospiraceae bacterium]
MTRYSRPALTRKARFRFDPISHEYLLLSPERGLVLNRTASEIVRLCTGANTVAMIIEILAASHPGSSPPALAVDLDHFLSALEQRGLIQEGAA